MKKTRSFLRAGLLLIPLLLLAGLNPVPEASACMTDPGGPAPTEGGMCRSQCGLDWYVCYFFGEDCDEAYEECQNQCDEKFGEIE